MILDPGGLRFVPLAPVAGSLGRGTYGARCRNGCSGVQPVPSIQIQIGHLESRAGGGPGTP